MLLGGLDIGTTGCKLAVYTGKGECLGKAYRTYPVRRDDTGHELNASDVWNAVRDVIREAAAAHPGIGAIGVTSFGESFAMLDEHDRPLLPVMLYTDPRGGEQCEKLVRSLGREKIILTTGLSPASMYSLPKLMWVKENLPDIWAKTRRVCLMQDYIVYMLSGTAQIEYSLATRSMAFDIHALDWSRDILDAAGIDASLLSAPVRMGSDAGHIRRGLAAELKLDPGTRIVTVSMDQVAAAIGCGIFDENCAVDGAGTVECVSALFGSCDPMKMASGCFAVVPYATPLTSGKYLTFAFSFTGGALISWFTDTLAGYAACEAKENGLEIHQVLERGDTGKPTGLLVLPHFAGAATPYMDPGSRGAILGLTVGNTQQDLYRGCMEGICYEMRLNTELLADAGVKYPALRTAGGGARSRVWTQMKADILNIPVTALKNEEAGAAGSAMLTGVASGVFPDLTSAAKVLVTPEMTYEPRPEVHAMYEPYYQKYRMLYHAVRPLV